MMKMKRADKWEGVKMSKTQKILKEGKRASDASPPKQL